jgi:hypothetical protein
MVSKDETGRRIKMSANFEVIFQGYNYKNVQEMIKIFVLEFQKSSEDLSFERELTMLAGRFSGVLKG